MVILSVKELYSSYLADGTPDGRVLSVVERAALERGHRFIRNRLQDALNAQATDLEKKDSMKAGAARKANLSK
jgi:hypothetical protein